MELVLEQEIVMEEVKVPGYERVIKVSHEGTGLEAIIALHNLTLGPALGGTRIYPYATAEAALEDALRLARGMTYKSAVTESGWGGGKSVIIADPKRDKTPALLQAFGQAVDRLQGLYICAEDVGSSPADMLEIAQVTPYVVGLLSEGSSGNPSPFTAWGTYRGIQAVLQRLFGSDSVAGKKIAIQGLGSVGMELARMLFWEGAELIVSDLDPERCRLAKTLYNAEVASDIYSMPCDVFSPCAMGGILNAETIARLRCKAVAGSANNQLKEEQDAERLLDRGILYAPDFVINAGGLINVSQELSVLGYQPAVARKRVHALYDQLMTIFALADQKRCSTQEAVVALVDERLANGIGRRTEAPCFHHAGT